ncbi:large extracellular alpha-helical protein [Rhodococcus sp. 06-1477-1B]|nr:large extracellular alpha-helical protein [Rhodococcus sp. 06-1477-1B]
MSERRLVRVAATSARVVAGAAVATAAVIGTVVGIAAPWPQYAATPVSVQATPAPGDTLLACDGPLLALGRSADSANSLSAAAAQQLVSGPAEADASSTALTGATADSSGDAEAFRAAPRDRVPTPLAAAGSATAASSDLIGFAASACRPPLAESWLVGGASTTGANDLVVLSNPGAVPATVQLSVYGAQGVSTPPSGQNLVVPAGGRRVVPLAGLLLGEESPVVRVVSSGAPVHASLQATLTRVLLPGGADQVAPLAQADTHLVVPGVQVLATDAGQVGTLLRLLSPGSDATATVTLVPNDPAVSAPAPTDIPLTTGLPTSLNLSGLAAGAYTVDVTATAPIVGAAWSTTGFGEGSDFAWYVPAPEISTPSTVAVAAGVGANLVIAGASADTTVTLTPVDGGAPVTTTVAAGASATVPVAAGVYRLESGAPVHAAVSYAGAGALASYPLWPADAAASALTILP